jgi:hypothetical protein
MVTSYDLSRNHINKELSKILVLLVVSILVPGAGVIVNVLYLYTVKGLGHGLEKFVYFNIALALGILAFSVHPGPIPGGDVYRYYLEMNQPHIRDLQRFANREKNWMNITFYGLMRLIVVSSLPKNALSFICIFVSYLCAMSTLAEVRENKGFPYGKSAAILIVLFFYVYSPYTLFSNYRNFLSVSLLSLAIMKATNNKKSAAFLLLVLGTISHNGGWVIMTIYLISKLITVPPRFNWIAVLVFLINERVSLFLIRFLSGAGFFPRYLNALATSYILGSKSSLFTSGSYGLIRYARAIVLLITTLAVFVVVNRREKANEYLRFLSVYLFFLISFANYRMVAERFILLGIVLFLPLYYMFITGHYPKSYKLLFIALMLANFDVFTFMDYGVRVGIGFPWNIFEPSVSLIKNYIIQF